MKLTIQRLTALTPQDRIDLAKIWPDLEIDRLEQSLNERHRLYAARFNDRLLGATDGFILRPFLYGGALLGFSGAVLSLVLSAPSGVYCVY